MRWVGPPYGYWQTGTGEVEEKGAYTRLDMRLAEALQANFELQDMKLPLSEVMVNTYVPQCVRIVRKLKTWHRIPDLSPLVYKTREVFLPYEDGPLTA